MSILCASGDKINMAQTAKIKFSIFHYWDYLAVELEEQIIEFILSLLLSSFIKMVGWRGINVYDAANCIYSCGITCNSGSAPR